LQGTPGEYIATARRKGEEWFAGVITNNDARNLKLKLAFLPKGKQYIATLYFDDAAVNTKTKVKREERKVNAATVLDMKLMPSGGQAIWIRPAK
jgi:alpha-glucosidase